MQEDDPQLLGDPLDRATLVKLVVTTIVLPLLALLAGWMWLA
ncbi:hypothetical protein [Mycolicibacterium confluentis]|nr:hypothetical protein [Mycolicibacterium confluentis]